MFTIKIQVYFCTLGAEKGHEEDYLIVTSKHHSYTFISNIVIKNKK